MGFYEQQILPRLLNMVMGTTTLAPYRERVVPQAFGNVLEIGIGAGHNLPLYSGLVKKVTGLDPVPKVLDYARERAKEAPCPVDFTLGSAEDLPFGDAGFDTVVVTFTFCSIPNPDRALAEIRRVLVPGGVLLFAEHGLAPEPKRAKWQRRLTPYWSRCAGGCRLDNPVEQMIAGQGFVMQDVVQEYAPGPKLLTYLTFGVAIAPR